MRESNVNLRTPALLVIMDGYGLENPGPGNAVSQARTPYLDGLFASCPWLALDACGEAVGLPAGQMGNSEVGHLNIGAGRVVYQDLNRINNACRDGSIQTNQVLSELMSQIPSDGALHLMGLMSDGGVHSHITHAFSLIDMAIAHGVNQVCIHAFMDGRDVAPTSGVGYLTQMQDFINQRGLADQVCIASVCGRYYAMDRDTRWDRVQAAYETLVCAANPQSISAISYLESSYANQVTDEFTLPASFSSRGIKDKDGVVFFNFRPDRARELSRAFMDEDFAGFKRKVWPRVSFACMTEYDPALNAPVAFPKEFPSNVLAHVISDAGLRQLHIAETEKYAHVTFFLNGGVEAAVEGESRVLIPSPKVTTYDLQPEMSQPEVSTRLARAIAHDEADLYVVNFANCDMVGHTGVIPAAVSAVEAVDAGVATVVDAILAKGGFALITADHGNADKMLQDDGGPYTAHSLAQVPLILVDPDRKHDVARYPSDRRPALCDIAPTLLSLMGLSIPQEMTGSVLFDR